MLKLKNKHIKRIGIISYHSRYNLGTMLQAYALQEAIKELETCYVEYINYVEGIPFKQANLKIRIKKIIHKLKALPKEYRSIFYNFLNKKKLVETKKKFDLFFSTYIHTSDTAYFSLAELEQLPPQYDIYIVGSDQVWNPTFLKDNGAYFLSFLKNDENKNSYAASIGVHELSEKIKNKYANYLSSFNLISCRESSGCECLSGILNRVVTHVVDPTLLLTPKHWKTIEFPVQIEGPYVLCYILGYKKCIRSFAKELGRKYNFPVYFIVSTYLDMQEDHPLFGVGPKEFLGLIRHARYVCTDSFHGTIFSINYKRDFYSFYKREGGEPFGDNSRIPTLLREYSLINRLKDEEFIEEEDINYEEISRLLFQKRHDSLLYLKKIISS
ncbi:MAG: polysaccharide pyruvyl transferase family protein [Tannerellaceae bacterium]|nr:polysaccharide pyruvyl transferase family protein [Tannerellaceae bacterium]